MSTIKKCPFCGEQAHLGFVSGSNQTYFNRRGAAYCTPTLHRVFCEFCLASTGSYEDVCDAIEAWNRRAE